MILRAGSVGSIADDIEGIARFAARSLATGNEAEALPVVSKAAEHRKSALLWQWLALLHRSLDQHAQALTAFEAAAALAPADAKIAQGRAQTAMEAGLPAVELFAHALSLAPGNGVVFIGYVAAKAAAGRGEEAAAEFREVLEREPMWTAGHQQYAQLQSTLGRSAEATVPLEDALARFPRATPLWATLLNIQIRRTDYRSLGRILERAQAAGIPPNDLAIFAAIHAAECDSEPFPAALFAQLPREIDQALDAWRIRHLLRVGQFRAALPIVNRALQGAYAHEVWPYAGTVWRVTGDPRSDWLEIESSLVSVIDLTEALPPLPVLSETLTALHLARGEYLDQSVRGGTQTDGPLFSRIDPVIQRVRAAVSSAVRDYVANLPPADPSHPLLRHRRDRAVRFAGSWSVRLRSGGHHSNHVHPQGWISSALYVALPPRSTSDDCAGWLSIGEPDELLGVRETGVRKIEPVPGRLVLFPSWMWHGTVPFPDGERLTIAFDVAPPI